MSGGVLPVLRRCRSHQADADRYHHPAKGKGRQIWRFIAASSPSQPGTFDYWGQLAAWYRQPSRILSQFVRYLAQFGAGNVLNKAKDEFIDQLASSRIERHGPRLRSRLVMRKWLTVEAGYYTVAMLPDGGMRKEYQNVSFAKMDQTEFSDLYRAVFRGCWRYVLGCSLPPEEAENALRTADGVCWMRFGPAHPLQRPARWRSRPTLQDPLPGLHRWHETTVLAHLPSAPHGMALNGDDLVAVEACCTCHDAIDGRIATTGSQGA